MDNQQAFILEIAPPAVAGWHSHEILPSVTIAQACLESGYGTSELAKNANNLFGIKGDYYGESYAVYSNEFINGDMTSVKSNFRKYPTKADSIKDHNKFFTSTPWRVDNYKKVVGETNYKKATQALVDSGYATDPNYAVKLNSIIERHNLTQYDKPAIETKTTIGKERETRMATVNTTPTLIIAGHGKAKNGSFDPGATGFITQGEHRYMRDTFIPAMKKYVPKGANVKFHTAYDVYSYGNIVSLARQMGSNTRVIELHFDATGSSSASGGHVIIHSVYSPDKLDLAIRDVIKKHIGVRYSHKGHQGISGRSNLANVNRTRSGNVNYRLVELGFGTNRKDSNILLTKYDAYAKDMVRAIFGAVKETASTDLQRIRAGAFKTKEEAIERVLLLEKNKIAAGVLKQDNKNYPYAVQAGAYKTLKEAQDGLKVVEKVIPDAYVTTRAGSWVNVTKEEKDKVRAKDKPAPKDQPKQEAPKQTQEAPKQTQEASKAPFNIGDLVKIKKDVTHFNVLYDELTRNGGKAFHNVKVDSLDKEAVYRVSWVTNRVELQKVDGYFNKGTYRYVVTPDKIEKIAK